MSSGDYVKNRLHKIFYTAKESVTAISKIEGNLTSSITFNGSVNNEKIGLYLIKYSVNGRNGDVYNDYRWISVIEQSNSVDETSNTIYFDESVNISVPASMSDSVTLSSDSGTTKLATSATIDKEGSYSVSVKDGATAAVQSKYKVMNLSAIKKLTNAATSLSGIKFVIDKTAPQIIGISNNDEFNNSVKVAFNEGSATLNGKSILSGTEVNVAGTYSLVVKDKAGNTSSANFSVVITPTVTLNKNTIILSGIGATEQLVVTISPSDAANKSVTWESSNPSVATVDSDGIVTSIGAGSAVITVKAVDGNKTATAEVTVIMPTTIVSVNEVTLDKNILNLIGIGTTERLTAIISPSDATNKSLTWESSNPSVATISSNGTITSIGKGSTTITVKTVDGNKTATAIVNIEEIISVKVIKENSNIPTWILISIGLIIFTVLLCFRKKILTKFTKKTL